MWQAAGVRAPAACYTANTSVVSQIPQDALWHSCQMCSNEKDNWPHLWNICKSMSKSAHERPCEEKPALKSCMLCKNLWFGCAGSWLCVLNIDNNQETFFMVHSVNLLSWHRHTLKENFSSDVIHVNLGRPQQNKQIDEDNSKCIAAWSLDTFLHVSNGNIWLVGNVALFHFHLLSNSILMMPLSRGGRIGISPGPVDSFLLKGLWQDATDPLV